VSDLENVVSNVNNQLDVMERFIARRFDEISMEINATAQRSEMAEDDMQKRFGEIMEIMGAISYNGEGASMSPANTGVELESVIEHTEEAANKILDAADRISDSLDGDDINWEDSAQRKQVLNAVRDSVQDIIMACTFQDLTGQRVRKTLENLQTVETRLNGTLSRLGIEVEVDKKQAVETHSAAESEITSQDDVDALFS